MLHAFALDAGGGLDGIMRSGWVIVLVAQIVFPFSVSMWTLVRCRAETVERKRYR